VLTYKPEKKYTRPATAVGKTPVGLARPATAVGKTPVGLAGKTALTKKKEEAKKSMVKPVPSTRHCHGTQRPATAMVRPAAAVTKLTPAASRLAKPVVSKVKTAVSPRGVTTRTPAVGMRS